MVKTLDYYLNVHNRNGLNGNNTRIGMGVHYGNNCACAQWPPNSQSVKLGDGSTASGRGPFTSVDIVGHEITHGLTEYTAQLVLQGESGAANESFSDIFGTAVECYVRGESNCNYLMGEDTSLPPGTPIRNLADPPALTYCYDPDGDGICNSTPPYPDHLDKEAYLEGLWDSGGTHANSTIQSKAFYLLAEGGTHPYSGIQVTGIGRAAAREIFFKALTGSVGLNVNSRLFYNVRQATLAVACANDPTHNPPYGSGTQACISTGQAWDAVGVKQNRIDDSVFFVQQHYLDFLNRNPDSAGWDYWINNITLCTPKPSCIQTKRVDTSAAFFLSIEFQQTGYLVERMYKTAYGDASGTSTYGGTHTLSVPVVRLSEFLPDTQQIGQGVVVGQTGWETVLENNKQAFAAAFVQRPRFTAAFPTSLTPAQFVDALNTNAGNVLSSTDRTTAINLFGGASDTNNTTARAQAVRQVAENQNLSNAEFNRAFVLMQYFGYLRRDPNQLPHDSDYSGYDFWLQKLNFFNGDYNQAQMVQAFITSIEYRERFGPA